MTAAVEPPLHVVRDVDPAPAAEPAEPTPAAEVTARPVPAPQTPPAVAPPAPPRPPGRANRIAATLILGTPAGAAIWGSATALTAIAREDQVAAPWTLPFCLDVLALGMVVVAVLVPGRGFLRRATPWACYLFSAALQVWEAWDLGPRAWGTHAAALVAAAIGSHVILDLWAAPAEPAPTPAPAPVVEEPGPSKPARPKAPVAKRPAPAKKATAPARSAKTTDEDLAAVALRLAATDPTVLSDWKVLAPALRNAGHPIGTTRARRVLALARQETPDA